MNSDLSCILYVRISFPPLYVYEKSKYLYIAYVTMCRIHQKVIQTKNVGLSKPIIKLLNLGILRGTNNTNILDTVCVNYTEYMSRKHISKEISHG